jgi:hypothetical protein
MSKFLRRNTSDNSFGTIFYYIGCSFCTLIRCPEHLIGRHCGISRQTEGHSFDDHLNSESVRVTPSSVVEASIVLCSVSLWLMFVSVQSACSLNILYLYFCRVVWPNQIYICQFSMSSIHNGAEYNRVTCSSNFEFFCHFEEYKLKRH